MTLRSRPAPRGFIFTALSHTRLPQPLPPCPNPTLPRHPLRTPRHARCALASQGQIIKRIIESIKDLVTDANLECSADGISLQVRVCVCACDTDCVVSRVTRGGACSALWRLQGLPVAP